MVARLEDARNGRKIQTVSPQSGRLREVVAYEVSNCSDFTEKSLVFGKVVADGEGEGGGSLTRGGRTERFDCIDL